MGRRVLEPTFEHLLNDDAGGTCKAQNWEATQRFGNIALLNDEILVDDEEAAIIMVFPRGQALNGIVDEHEIVKDPLSACRRIFVRKRHLHMAETGDPQDLRQVLMDISDDILAQAGEDTGESTRSVVNTTDTGFDTFGDGPVTMAHYQEVIRMKVLAVLEVSGIRVRTFESIDGDEVFMKLSVDRQGSVIRQLAQHYQYKMPFSVESYKDMPKMGSHPGHCPMKDAQGQSSPAYQEFEFDVQELLEPFRQVDEIRLLEMRLDEWLNLSEMVEQSVVSRVFAAANYDQTMDLHDTWGDLRRIWRIPDHGSDDDIRNYFGESIAFFFRWFAFYTRGLVAIAVVGGICALRRWEVLGLSLEKQRYIQIVFAFILVGWASTFNRLFQNRAARAKLRWGMKEYDSVSLERSQYRPDLEGTWQEWAQKKLADLIVILFCTGFIALIGYLENVKKRWKTEGNETFEEYGSLICVGTIKVTSAIWNKVAPLLADLQNHRTDARWNDALTYILSSVKLFVALFPFFNLAFLKKYMEPICGQGSLESTAWKVYGQTDAWPLVNGQWPSILKPEIFNQTVLEGADLSWLNRYRADWHGRYCVWGCYPVQCFQQPGDKMTCVTNCQVALENNLWSAYITHIVCTVIFVLIPIILTKREVRAEVEKARESSAGNVQYSFMQFQAKCHEQAAYAYASWGGSYVEDFLELAIGFALLTCFGIALPSMAVFALIGHIVEYRLLAFRMTNVTCRPMPFGAEGIGSWQSVFETISVAAVAINVGIAVFVMHPMRDWEVGHQFGAFIFLEHAMLLLRNALNAAIPEEPEDVKRIQDFNAHFKRKVVKYAPLNVPRGEKQHLAGTDITLSACPGKRHGPDGNALVSWL
mmetsp:Transcript_14443/g.37008  ORF Transcript_14443/g.37008 Transcript_14443/m.37008 type:complete len:869 (-) Transcript_14443:62-2668(-)